MTETLNPIHTGQTVGYVRVSSEGQNEARQLEGEALDHTFCDKLSGGTRERPELNAAIRYVRKGDTLVVHSMDRLARNLNDLRNIVGELTGRGVVVRFVKEGMTFTGADSPMSTLLLSMMGAFAEFERAIIRERQAEGIKIAKASGVYKGRKPSLDAEGIARVKERVEMGVMKSRVAKDFGISRATLYGYLAAKSPAQSMAGS
jgi:DNA invertase Pin-like site-specific DNA recombinase